MAIIQVNIQQSIGEGVLCTAVCNDPHSANAIMQFISEVYPHFAKIVITPTQNADIKYTDKQQYLVKQNINVNTITNQFVTNTHTSQTAETFQNQIHVDKEQEAILLLKRQALHNVVLIVLGDNVFVERLTNLLQYSTNITVFDIDLNVLQQNYQYFRQKLQPNVKLLSLVKADAYGNGKNITANFLQWCGADYLAVAITDEGVKLRNEGIHKPIMVMVPHQQAFEQIVTHRLEPVIYSNEILNNFLQFLQHNNIQYYPVHIKIETGMYRAGFIADELENLSKTLSDNRYLKVVSVFSHTAAADEAQHDDFSMLQVQRFDQYSQLITSKLPYNVIRHLANSLAIERLPMAHFDMVRLGIGLYFGGSIENGNLKNPGTLASRIAQIKHVPMGETVGYGRRGRITRPTVIATLPVGYGDGLTRQHNNGKGGVMINGKYAPFIGNICMDYCMVDVTDLDVKPDDIAVFFDGNITAGDVAKLLQTISYEIITSVSARVKRRYTYQLNV